jgi:hypothetical protein
MLPSRVTLAAGLAVAVVITAPVSAPTPAHAASARQAMSQCVNRVLTGLARRRAPEGRVGPAVLSRCDRPLRASLSEAIRRGEAPDCRAVSDCIDVARNRAVASAIASYRRLARRR